MCPQMFTIQLVVVVTINDQYKVICVDDMLAIRLCFIGNTQNDCIATLYTDAIDVA